MGMMRQFFLLACMLGFASAASTPQLEAIHTVYLLPMGNALDQYLASRLTELGLFQVVADPQKADGIFTDKIGMALEQKLDELYPPETPKKSEDEAADDRTAPGQRVGGFSRGRGSIFLVDRRTRNVVWSMYAPVRGGMPDQVNSRAKSIVDHLRKDLKPAK